MVLPPPDNRNESPGPPEAALTRLRQMLRAKDTAGLHRAACQAVEQLHQAGLLLKALEEDHQQLREQIAALCAPEHYPATITHISDGEPRLVRVAFPSGQVCEVGVHPEVPRELLLPGALAFLARERNCVLRVEPRNDGWHEVGTFQQHVAEDRIQVESQGGSLVVGLAHSLRGETFRSGDLVGFDSQGCKLAFTRLENREGGEMFLEDVHDVDFKELVGLEPVIELIKTIIDFRYAHPEIAARHRLSAKNGLLFYGPPGNGKTSLARCTAAYLQRRVNSPARFMYVSGSDDYRMWLGQSEQRLRSRFEAVRAAAEGGPVVLFFDEVDALARRRGAWGSGAPDRILGTLLSELDGLTRVPNVLVMAATNTPELLDPALVRPGRLDSKIEIPAPNRRAALAILKRYLHGDRRPLDPAAALEPLCQTVVSAIFATNGPFAQLGLVKCQDGRQLSIRGRDLLSAAMLERAVLASSQSAACREARSRQPEGIREEDLRAELSDQLRGTARLLRRDNVKAYVSSIPEDVQPLAVVLHEELGSDAPWIRN